MTKSNKNKVNVLGTTYTIVRGDEKKYPILGRSDGYCDFTAKQIVITNNYTDYEWEDMEAWYARVVRHEVVHAFLYESGLDSNSDWGRNEEIIDWIALQIDKIYHASQSVL